MATSTYPAHGWLPPGAHFDWQHADQGRDFVTDWQGIVQAPGDGVCIAVGSDRPFPGGFGPRYAMVRITSGAFAGHDWYIGHCTSLVSPGEHFGFGHALARADQGHNFAGTTGGWVELGNRQPNGTLGPNSPGGHWFDAILATPLVTGAQTHNRKGADHSTGDARIGAALQGAGYGGVLRYAAAGRPDVSITRAEADDLKAHGIQISVFNEHSANYLLGGFGTGAQTAAGARDVCRAAGLPDGVIYMSADFDATNGGPTSPGSPGDRNMQQILSALQGAASVIGQANVGFYGSYYAIDWLVGRAPWIRYYVQTVSWSAGLVHPRANVFQHADRTVTVGGVELDPDDLLTADWGQRGGPKPPTPEEIMAITAAPNVDGRLEVFVEAQDGSVWHTYQEYEPNTKNIKGWSGGKAGVRVAQLSPLAAAPGK